MQLTWVHAAERIDFARDVQPILSDRCYTCHGPDSGQRATDLRLDQQASAHAIAITPGKVAESELIRRIESTDADEVMPPSDSNLKLSESEKQVLRRWIEEGAQYAQHWAFVAPVRPQVPQMSGDWPRSDLDRLVLRRLREHGLEPQSSASPEMLIRRLSFDLTGLPPTLAEVDAFLEDYRQNSDAAYEHLVDRLLSSRRYGERMAVDWLDAARYADTYGYQNDRYRAMWPWRDWAVRAFNENLPYDAFVTWQIAGDLLPEAGRDQILATAFNRNHRQTNEGGSVEEEFRAEYVADRVNTLGAAFLGLTLECCRCHDHKYDPMTQREYYQLAAFFNSIDESGLYSHFTEATPTPTLLLSSDAEQAALAEAEQAIARAEAELSAWQPSAAEYQAWRASLTDVRPPTSARAKAHVSAREDVPRTLREQLEQALQANLIGHYPLDVLESQTALNLVDGSRSGKATDNPRTVQGKLGGGLQFSGDNGLSVPSGGDFSRNQPFTISVWLKAEQFAERAVILHRSRAWTDSGSRGYELLIEDGKLSAALIHFWPGNALRIQCRDELPLHQWVHVTMRYDGSSRADGLQLFIDGQQAEVDRIRDKLTKNIKGADGVGGGDVERLALGERFRDVGFKSGCVDELKVFTRDLSELEVRYLYLRDAAPDNVAEYLHNADSTLVRDFFVRRSPQRKALSAELFELRRKRSELGDAIPEIMVMREQPEPRPTTILLRGAYDAPGEPVERAMPASIFEQDAAQGPLDRLSLANWLTDSRNPLTARVAVNRFWQALFGIGLVSTAEDFGLQGQPPVHPEVLDWLSVEFVQSGWDVKHLLKTIVMSATYRQASEGSLELLTADPENRWLARGPAHRLPAEMLRDAALLVGGLLVEQIGGPAVKPYQPEGLWEEKSGLKYVRDVGAGSHRRSLYTYWKRTSPPPAMMTFDASNREVCVVRRQATMTPLQSLVLLNDPQFVEAARGLAERTLQAVPNASQRAERLFRSVTGRRPTEQERQAILKMVEQQRALFTEGNQSVDDWLSVGDHRPGQDVQPLDLAAWSVVAGGLMSLDAALMKR